MKKIFAPVKVKLRSASSNSIPNSHRRHSTHTQLPGVFFRNFIFLLYSLE